MLQNKFYLRQFRLLKWSFFVNSTNGHKDASKAGLDTKTDTIEATTKNYQNQNILNRTDTESLGLYISDQSNICTIFSCYSNTYSEVAFIEPLMHILTIFSRQDIVSFSDIRISMTSNASNKM